MKFRKLAIILAISSVMVITFVGCGSSKKDSGASNKEEAAATEDVAPDNFPEKLTAKKINSIDVDMLYTGMGGMYYKDGGGKYGIMTFDGKKDTGAKYAFCEGADKYFVVSDTTIKDAKDVEELNSNGLVDAEGNEIIPQAYATIKVLSERYAKVSEVTETTVIEDDAIVYFHSGSISFGPQEGDTLFKGNWYIYDLSTGEKVEGVTGTKGYSISVNGNYISYITDAQERMCVNADGKKLPEGAKLLENGSYTLVENNEGTVYSTEDEKLFTYKVNGFVPEYYEEGYYVGTMTNDTKKYVLMDEKGSVVSAEFEKYPHVYGTMLWVEDKVYDFEGNQVIEGSYEYVYFDKKTNNCWFLKNEQEQVFINEDGDVLYKVENTDDIIVDTAKFLSKNGDGKYYSLKDNDFVFEGYGIAPWLVKANAENNLSNIIDVISGETIIESYSSYSYGGHNQTTTYIYAKKVDGGIDIYTVK